MSVLFSGQPEIWVEFIHGIPSPVLAVSLPVFPIYSPVVMVAPNSFLWFFKPERLRICY